MGLSLGEAAAPPFTLRFGYVCASCVPVAPLECLVLLLEDRRQRFCFGAVRENAVQLGFLPAHPFRFLGVFVSSHLMRNALLRAWSG